MQGAQEQWPQLAFVTSPDTCSVHDTQFWPEEKVAGACPSAPEVEVVGRVGAEAFKEGFVAESVV